MIEAEDNLNFQDNKDIKSKIGDEQIYFSDKMRKIATEKRLSFLSNQERNLLITDLAIYNLNGTEIKRRIKIEDIKAITVSKTSNQFIIHGSQDAYDYLFVYPDRRKIAKILQSAFESKTGKDLLFCKKEDKDLTKFVVGKTERKKNPYLFKIDQNELTSIKDYIEEQAEEEPEPKKSTPPPKSSSKSETSSGEPKVVSGKGKGVPPPPPPPPPPPKVPTVATTQKAAPTKTVDLAAELAAKKNNLAHVEVKEYVSPALQKPEEGGAPQTGNSMMAAIIAKRNQMKKIGGAGAGTSTTSKPPSKPSAPIGNAPKQGGTTIAPKSNISSGTGGMPKPVTNTAPKINTGGVAPKPAPKPATTGGAKPPMKMGGGGGSSAFAAKMAALQARMAGGGGGGGSTTSSSTPASSGPSKPIVELCEGNTKRMDINKVIGNLEKEKKNQASKKLSSPPKVKIVSAKGKGVPPPPPPPPPPPMK